MHVLITGGGGFIARHVGTYLRSLGHTTTAYDNGSLGAGHFVFGSVLDPVDLAKYVGKADAVVHLAAVVGFKHVLKDPALTLRTEVDGMRNLIAALKAHPVPTVFTSSSAVYGQGTNGAASPEDGPFAVGGPALLSTHYAYGKIAAECLAQAAVQLDHLPIRIARLFNVAGPGQSAAAGFVVPRMVRAAIHHQTLTVYAPGTQTRTFGHVRDVAKGISDLLLSDVLPGTVVNLGGTETVTMTQLAQIILDTAQSRGALTLIPSPYGSSYEEVHDRRPDLTRARALLGYQCPGTLEDIVREVVTEHREMAGCAQP